MAKKKNPAEPISAPVAPRKRAKKSGAPIDVGGSTAPEPVAEASDKSAFQSALVSDTPLETSQEPSSGTPPAGSNGVDPAYDDIARAAYERYLSRGGDHGRDFDDWLEAEQALKSRK